MLTTTNESRLLDATTDRRCVDALRVLAADMVERAASGHPGLPLGAAPAAWALWSRHLRFDPDDAAWPDRDRFVLSAGHGSALLYALLHFAGQLSLEDLRSFRRLGSRTPGHPEYGHTPGVEVTTGPLGQGLAHAVGLALAERMAAATWNGATTIVDHRTFVLCSDGDLMEGVSGEASSLAGHLGLGRLIVLWDANEISIDGSTDLAFTEDVCGRYRAYGWHVGTVDDGEDVEAISTAIDRALAVEDRPSFIRVRTTIGHGAPTKAGTPGVHGAPLGAEELAGLRRALGWSQGPFELPDEVEAAAARVREHGRQRRAAWDARLAAWGDHDPVARAAWDRRAEGSIDPLAFEGLPTFEPGEAVATRSASGAVLTALAQRLPELVGGSADLAESTCTELPGGAVQAGSYGGRHIHFGVREHAMAAVLNGLALHGGYRAVGSTFLVFTDYLRPSLRLAALMGLPVVHVGTHDSIGLGEDGPTHQPVEHLAALRAMPGIAVVRPADANETVDAWQLALERTEGPTVLALSRQALPVLAPGPARWLSRWGARVVRDVAAPAAVAVATGSEVATAIEAAERLAAAGHRIAVVSMPWRERFMALDDDERARILPPGVPVVVVEAGASQGWEIIAGPDGALVTLDRFGASGTAATVQRALGLDADAVVAALAALIEGGPRG